MKSRTLLFIAILAIASMGASAQTFHVEWNEPDTVRGDGTKIIKRTGTFVNDTDQEKRIRIRYDLTNVNLDHFVQICMTECFVMFPGGEDDAIRNDQVVPGNGRQNIYVDADANGAMGESSVTVDLYEKSTPSDKVSFTVTFIFEKVSSVVEASERGLTVSPFPAMDAVTLRGGTDDVREAHLYSNDGTLLRSYGVAGEGTAFNVQGLATGTYHLLLRMTNGEVLRAPVSIVR